MGLFLRKVNLNDCGLLFDWANDEEVRKNSFNKNKILYENHIDWFNSMIKLNNCIIFILCYDDIDVGQVRINIENNCGIIDYSIDKRYRGRGYGYKILYMLEKYIISDCINVNRLVGNVKNSNIKSQKAFEKNNYKKILEKECFIYLKEI
ncbi:GNAT family N-acetyltransferase [Clostridium drakei]|nr:GNAT family N-acetyltransferase [Clostridium drakei]